MNEIQIFNNEEFGQVRTVEIDGKPYFVANDVARALGYAVPKDAVARHCKGALKRRYLTEGGNQEMKVIPEGDLYRLITHSKLESAERFERWVFDEVLPTIRKTGSYEMPKQKAKKPSGSNRPALSSVNMMVKNVMSTLEKAKVEPIFVAAEVKRLYTDLGYEVKAPLVTDQEMMPKLYDCTEIAKELGILSKNGKPHNQAVADIIRKLHIEDNEIKRTAFSRNGHDDVTVQYLPSVVDKIRGWLEENGYPTKIPFVDAAGNQKMRTVFYKDDELLE